MFGLIFRILALPVFKQEAKKANKGVRLFGGVLHVACFCLFCVYFSSIFMNFILYVPYKTLLFSRYKVVKMGTNTKHMCFIFILNQPGKRSLSSTTICCVDYQPLYMYTCVKFCIRQ